MTTSSGPTEYVTPEGDETIASSRAGSRVTHESSARRIVVNTIYRAGGEGVGKAASFALFLIAARILGTTGFGELTFALSLAGALFVLSGFGTDQLLVREVAREGSSLRPLMGNILLFKLATSAVLMVIAITVGFVWTTASDARVAVLLISASVAIDNISITWQAAFLGFQRTGHASAALIVQRCLTAALGIGVLVVGGGLVAVSAAFLVGSLVGLSVLVIALPRSLGRHRWNLDVRKIPSLVRVALPIGIAALFFTLMMRMDTVILGLIERDNPHEVGIYGAAFRLCEATMFLSWSFGGAIYPWLSRQSATELATLSRGYELGLLAIGLVLTPIGLIFALLASPIIRLLYGDAYVDATTPLRLLSVVVVAYGINFFTSTSLTAHDRPGLFTRLLTAVAALNVILSLALIPPFGASGAALSAAISGATLALSGVLQTRSVFGGMRFRRLLSVPTAGGIAMTAAIVLVPGGLFVQITVGLATFAAVAAGVLRRVAPEEWRSLGALRQGPQ